MYVLEHYLWAAERISTTRGEEAPSEAVRTCEGGLPSTTFEVACTASANWCVNSTSARSSSQFPGEDTDVAGEVVAYDSNRSRTGAS